MLSVTPGYWVLEIAHNADRRWWGRHGRPVLRSASAPTEILAISSGSA